MSLSRRQSFIAAPVHTIWELVSDVERHPEWWPRFIEVECEGIEQGCTYRAVMKAPVGHQEMTINVESLDECRDLLIRCIDTGTYFHVALAGAQGGTFIDGECGMEPRALPHRAFDAIAGKRYFRSWLNETFEALDRAALAQVAAR